MSEGCRARRFGDWENYKDLFQSGKQVENTRPFFEGENVRERMNCIRKSIDYIRSHWDRYDEFVRDLHSLLKGENSDFGDGISSALKTRLSRLFSVRKEWNDRPTTESKVTLCRQKRSTSEDEHEYDVVHLYTAEKTYQQIFSFLNRVFRSELSEDSERVLNSVVFLVELLNIDLYNYTRSLRLKGFEGVVYRGMGISSDDFQAFSRICQQPISERYISIPLGMISASQNMLPAKQFIEDGLKKDPSRVPLLWKIHVINLEDRLLQVYQTMFPTSVVSSICAVPISSLSYYPHEEEVLLRGPFFQVLNFYEHGTVKEKLLYMLEVVMLNSNRDHPTNQDFGSKTGLARSVFGTVVSIGRCQFCLDYCQKNGFVDDAMAYCSKLEEDKQKLKRLQSI